MTQLEKVPYIDKHKAANIKWLAQGGLEAKETLKENEAVRKRVCMCVWVEELLSIGS
jgi:hypothetical protein